MSHRSPAFRKQLQAPKKELFSLTVFLSAFLLFQVQPLISRYILPWFGGTPAVWSTALLFFQTLLLSGYAFAHWAASKSTKRLRIYLGLLFLSILLLIGATFTWGSPLLPDSTWKPSGAGQPLLKILAILSASVGLPFFLLAATSPLLQSWVKHQFPTRQPYWLYAISNLGSILGLISYPVVFEPIFGLSDQSKIWAGGYIVFVGLCFYIGIKTLTGPQQESQNHATNQKPAHIVRKLLWLGLPAYAATLLLAVTNQLTQEVAVIPFLWVLPLGLYLLSFVISFSGEKWYPRLPLIGLFALSTLGAGYRLNTLQASGLLIQTGVFSVFLLLACWICHGELYQLRPEASQLTTFYLYVALGGAIGGLFVNLIAPLIFNGYWELHLGTLLCWGLIVGLLFFRRPPFAHKRWFAEGVLLVMVILGVSVYLFGRQINQTMNNVVHIERNFYGVLRVQSYAIGDPPAAVYDLKHGSTSHGFQFKQTDRRMIPTSYYGRQSGIGLAIQNFQAIKKEDTTLDLGLVGLGPGVLAAYGQPGDDFRFYEINPDVIDLALGKGGYFSFIADSPARIEIVPGDARLSLESEITNQQPNDFDVLVLDAFSSDSIPVHLLTVEAFDLYLQHLKPEGVIAAHISNRYLDLVPLLLALADYHELDFALIHSQRDNSIGSSPALWMLLSKNTAFFQIPEIQANLYPLAKIDPPVRPWTDNYANLLPLIRAKVLIQDR